MLQCSGHLKDPLECIYIIYMYVVQGVLQGVQNCRVDREWAKVGGGQFAGKISNCSEFLLELFIFSSLITVKYPIVIP